MLHKTILPEDRAPDYLQDKYSPSKVMQIVKSITAREFFKKFPEVKKQLWGGEFWSDGGYIGTVGDGAMADTIRNYVETQGPLKRRKV